MNLLPRWPRLLWLLPTFLVLWFSSIQLHLEPISPSLDSSWLGALSYFAAKRFQYGTDIIFTYGPLAYLGTGVYSGYLFRERVIWELVFKAINAGVLCWIIAHLPKMWGLVYLAFCLVFVLAEFPEIFYFFSITILVIYLLRGTHGTQLADILAIMVLSAVSLMKYNYLVLVLLGIGAVTVAALSRRSFGRAGWIFGSFLGGFLLCWKLADQELRNLGSYLSNALEISSGYKEAMGVASPNNLVVILGLFCLVTVFSQLIFVTIKRRDVSVSMVALFLGGEMVLNWNHGFIRADQHVLTFFELCPAALISSWATGAIQRLPKLPLYATTAIIGGTCLAGMYAQDSALISNRLGSVAKRIQSGWNLVFHEAGIERELERQLAQQKAQSSLPRVKGEVGQASIDVLGYEQAIALLNDLNYSPRPIFQGYTAYTKRLMEENWRFYHSVRAPAYALVKYQTIDNRYPALDDAAVFTELLYGYVPLFTENGYSLWKKLPQPKATRARYLSAGVTTFGKEVAIPQTGIVWLELEIQESVWGKIAALLYKPPILEMAVTPGNAPAVRCRIIREMAASGFIINPVLLTGDDLISLAGQGQTTAAASFAVWIHSRDLTFFDGTIRYRMTSLPLPAGY